MTDRLGFPMTADEFEILVSRGVRRGVREIFITLGLDLDDAEMLAQWHKQQGWLRDRVRDHENGRSANIEGRIGFRNGLMIAGISAAVSALFAWVKAHLP